MYYVDDFPSKWELMNSVHDATLWDSEYFDKFFAEAFKDKVQAEQDSKEYQEYLRLKEKFEGK